jgi:hypothetical protein
MTTLAVAGVIRQTSLAERALLRAAAALHAAVLAHAARRIRRRPLEERRSIAAADADGRRACVHLGLLPR